MKTFLKKILVPVDFTETSINALISATNLCKISKSELLILHVIEAHGASFNIVSEQLEIKPKDTEIKKIIKNQLEILVNKYCKPKAIVPELIIEKGSVVQTMLKKANSRKASLIMMGTNGSGGLNEVLIGSNAEKVANFSDIPVLTIKDAHFKGIYKNIVIPIDNELHSREKLNYVIGIANLFSSKVFVAALPGLRSTQDVSRFMLKVESIKKYLDKNNLSYKVKLVSGNNPAKAALTFAKKVNASLIVINTGHESEVTGVFAGLFARQIVNHSQIPVLSIKPTEGRYTTIADALLIWGNPYK